MHRSRNRAMDPDERLTDLSSGQGASRPPVLVWWLVVAVAATLILSPLWSGYVIRPEVHWGQTHRLGLDRPAKSVQMFVWDYTVNRGDHRDIYADRTYYLGWLYLTWGQRTGSKRLPIVDPESLGGRRPARW